MENETIQKFMQEFRALQEKYGVYVHAEYEYEIDYGPDDDSYIAGVSSYLAFCDKDGFKLEEAKEIAYQEEE